MAELARQVDVAVIGGGPAGLAAAAGAAAAGAQTLLLERGAALGGQIFRHAPGSAPPRRLRPWLVRLAASGARIETGTTLIDATPDGEGFRLWLVPTVDPPGPPGAAESTAGTAAASVVAARRLILAAGARELFLPFPGWTLPGVVGVGALHALLSAGLPLAGARVVLAGSGPLLLAVAARLHAAGARVRWIAEQAPRARLWRFARLLSRLAPGRLVQGASYRLATLGTPYSTGSWVLAAIGQGRVEGVRLTIRGRTHELACDYLGVGFGLVPNLEVPALLSARLAGGSVVVDARQQTSVAGLFAAGESCGIAGVEAAFVEGRIAGLAAAEALDPARHAPLLRRRAAERRLAAALATTFALRPELGRLARPETIVCRCEDVPFAAFDSAWSPRQAKLATRAGMGPCQGRVCGPALACLFGWQGERPRPPLMPTALGRLAALSGAPAATLHNSPTPEERR